MHKRSLLMAALVAMCVSVLFACGESSAATSVVSGGGSTTTTTKSHFKVGQQVKVGGDYIVTVNSFKRSVGDDFTQPKAGNTFVILDVTVKNTSKTAQNISSALSFTLKDATGQKYTEAFLSGATPPDGAVVSGDQIKGQIVYEVLASQHAFTFSFQADILNADLVIWDVSA